MAIIEGILPPSRETWELACTVWKYFPLITLAQWVVDWYPQGKTSNNSIFNLPGRWAWMTMEAPGFITLLYIMNTLPQELGIKELPTWNWVMAGLFTTHYLYRAILFPLINPSMSPTHILVWAMALSFQLFNALSIGGWLAGHGPTSSQDWSPPARSSSYTMVLGVAIWAAGLASNIWHDEDLREIRRSAARKQRKQLEEEARRTGKSLEEVKTNVDKVYVLPENGLFKYVLYAHYLCEWIEWAGFWVVGGWACVPARSFLLNEFTTMFPRALQGKRWYLKKFGKEKVSGRKAIIPGVI